jgi:AP-4 complex subunit epsilon-1
VSTALTAICKLVSGETIGAILPQVTELLSHATDLVRKKAVMVLHRFYQRSPSAVAHLLPRFRTALCDKARERRCLGL